MGLIGRQFGRPSGMLGGITGRFMARNNAALNHWIAAEAVEVARPDKILEVGSGPGVGTAALLEAAPDASVTAVDPSPAMARQLGRRNRGAISSGRLTAVTAGLSDLDATSDHDLVVAVHVLYFWVDPVRELRAVRDLLRPGGVAALGYQLRRHMPPVAQRDFPATGHRLYDTDADVAELMSDAGLNPSPVRVLGSKDAPTGRLLMGTRTI